MAILRPSSDLVTGGWTSSPSGTLASCIDETTASDTDYIETTGTGNSSIILLGSGSDPGNDNNHKLSYRASSTSETLNVDVVQMAPAIVTSKQPWRSQPQALENVDWSNKLCRGLRFAIDPAIAQHDAVFVKRPTKFTTNGIRVTALGSQVHLNNSVSYYLRYPCPVSSGDMTMAFIALPSTTSGMVAMMVSDTTNGNAVGNYLDIESSAWKIVATTNNDWVVAGTATPSIVKPSSIVGTFSITSGQKIYVNGVLSGSNATARNPVNLNYLTVGAYAVGASLASPWNGYIGLALLWDRVLSETEAREFSTNPWQIFRPSKKVSYFDVPNVIATRTPTLTSSPADYSIDLTSGEAATITDYTKLGLRFRT